MRRNTATGWRATRTGNWLMGCGIALAVIVLLVIGVGVFVAMNWRGWAASGMDAAFDSLIVEMPIDDEQKARTEAVVDDFIGRFRDGSISLQQMTLVMKEVAESPVLPAGIAMGVGQSYFKESGLTEAQKADGMTQVRRVAQGLSEQTIDPSELRDVLAPLRAEPSDTQAIQFDMNGERIRIKAPKAATDDDLLAFIEQARAIADQYAILPDPPAIDLATELDLAIRRALGEPIDAPIEPGEIPAPVETVPGGP